MSPKAREQHQPPSYRPEPESLEPVRPIPTADPEQWLAERIRCWGADIYAGGPYPTFADRLAAAILRDRLELEIAGYKSGLALTFAQAWMRVFGKPLPARESFHGEHKTGS